ncbi:MAG TPA: DUF3999 domain-containing protein [Aliidongia sp.]|nr:DUF3999 domain-containing protein [Aliidongia sp.]
MIRRLALLALTLLPMRSIAADMPGAFAAGAPLVLEGAGPYYKLTLPVEAVLAAHFPDLRDLRIFDSRSETVPFALMRAPAATEETLTRDTVAWFPLYAAETRTDAPEVQVDRRSDGTVVSVRSGAAGEAQTRYGYLLDLSRITEPVRALELDWDPAASGFQEVSVEASDDLEGWRRWKDRTELARLDFNGQHIERRQIELPGEQARYLRVTWRSPRAAPTLTAAAVTVGGGAARPAVLLWSEPAVSSPAEKGAYQWRLPHPVLIEALRIGLPRPNSLLPNAELSGRNDTLPHAEWTALSRVSIYRLALDAHETTQPDIEIPPVPIDTIRLAPDGRTGGISGGLPTLSIGLPAPTVLFLAQGDPPFRLAIGNGKVKSADLAPVDLVPGWSTPAAPPIGTAQLGGWKQLPAPPPLPTGIDWKRLLLWAVLFAGIAAAGAMAMQLLRQLRR